MKKQQGHYTQNTCRERWTCELSCDWADISNSEGASKHTGNVSFNNSAVVPLLASLLDYGQFLSRSARWILEHSSMEHGFCKAERNHSRLEIARECCSRFVVLLLSSFGAGHNLPSKITSLSACEFSRKEKTVLNRSRKQKFNRTIKSGKDGSLFSKVALTQFT